MKKVLLSILILLFAKTVLAEVEKAEYKKAATAFQTHYNANEYQEIVDMFSLKMMQEVPLVKITEILNNFKAQAGQLKTLEFKNYQGSFAVYKGSFEKAVLGVNISLNGRKEIDGLYFNAYIEDDTPELVRNITKMNLPFDGEWFVFWGGDTKKENYHVEAPAQRNAFDFLMVNKQGRSFKNDGKKNEDYYCFGKKLVAPCDAEVILVVDGVKDNVPGVMNPFFTSGNTVMLKTANEEFLFFGHFKQHSIVVKQGDKIKAGALLGLCGNSGNSSEPHLHFHIQNIEDINGATGTKCYFDNIMVNGKLLNNYSPVKNDKVKNK